MNRYVARDKTYIDLTEGKGVAWYDHSSRYKPPKLVEVNFAPLPSASQLENPIVKARTKINNRQLWGYLIVHYNSIRFKTGHAPSPKILLPSEPSAK